MISSNPPDPAQQSSPAEPSPPSAQLTAAIDLATLPEYETKLLMALAFFLGREASAQGRACLSMYLRQSEARIMAQARYYTHQYCKATGESLDAYDLLDLIAESPEQVRAHLQTLRPVHLSQEADVFDDPATGR